MNKSNELKEKSNEISNKSNEKSIKSNEKSKEIKGIFHSLDNRNNVMEFNRNGENHKGNILQPSPFKGNNKVF